MRRIVCVGCGVAEDLDNPIGDIRTVQLIDMTPLWQDGGDAGNPEKPVQEDLCAMCRKKVREEFFNVPNQDPMGIPLMKAV